MIYIKCIIFIVKYFGVLVKCCIRIWVLYGFMECWNKIVKCIIFVVVIGYFFIYSLFNVIDVNFSVISKVCRKF